MPKLNILLVDGLRAGRTIGTVVPATLPGHCATVDVQAIVDEAKGYVHHDVRTGRLSVVSTAGEDPIAGFKVRHQEIDREHLKYEYEFQDNATIDETIMVAADQTELEQVLSRWTDDFSKFYFGEGWMGLFW